MRGTKSRGTIFKIQKAMNYAHARARDEKSRLSADVRKWLYRIHGYIALRTCRDKFHATRKDRGRPRRISESYRERNAREPNTTEGYIRFNDWEPPESISQEKHRIALCNFHSRRTKTRDSGRARRRAAKMLRTRVLKRDQKRPKRPERIPACARGVRAAECRDIATRLD
jgi:hypothetical protein